MGITKKDLEQIIEELHEENSNLTDGRIQAAEELKASQEALAEAHAAIAAAEEAAATAEAARVGLQQQLEEAAAATAPAAMAGQGVLAAQVDPPQQIPRPKGTGWSIQESMQVTKLEYAEIQRTIRSLVIRAVLDWTDDFRHQDVDKMATLFRAARTAHPILNWYANNWATAAIACQYMQNKCKYAYKQGYISKRRTHQVRDQENTPTSSCCDAGGA